jgi:4-amino-4-deoxy-L-arabinose transferase-like glycosyltransferase
MDRETRRKIILLFVLALALRLGMAFAVGPFTEPDSLTYDNLARNMVGGSGYTDTRPYKILDASMSVPPVYPSFLAAVYSVFGFHYGPVIAVQQVLGALLVVLAYFIGARLFGARVGFWSALVLAVHPWLILLGSSLMTEALFTFLFAGSMFFLVTGLSGGKTRYVVLAGFILGLAILCRASFQLYVLLVPAVFGLTLKTIRSVVKHSLAFLIPALLLVSVWGFRNHRTHGFFGLTAVGGVNFLAGLNPPASSYDDRDPVEKALREACDNPAPQSIASVLPSAGLGRMVFKSGTVICSNLAVKALLDQGLTLPEIDRKFMTVALKQIRRAPPRYLKRCISQGISVWSGYQTEWLGGVFDKKFSENVRDHEYFVAAAKIVSRPLLGAVVLILTALGVWAVFKKGPKLGWVPISTFVYLTAVCAAFNLGYVRYRMPLEPYIVMVCLYGLSFFGKRFSALRGDQAPLLSRNPR